MICEVGAGPMVLIVAISPETFQFVVNKLVMVQVVISLSLHEYYIFILPIFPSNSSPCHLPCHILPCHVFCELLAEISSTGCHLLPPSFMGNRSLDTVVRAVKWAYNPNHSPNLDASPNH